MGLPLSYSLRNVGRRPWRAALTGGGIAIVVFSAVIMLALVAGMRGRLADTGDPANLLLISRKGQNLMFSNIEADEEVQLYSLEGVAADALGDPLISPEIMHMSFVETGDDSARRSGLVYVRGVEPVAIEVHRGVRLLEGHFPEDEGQVMVGAAAFAKLGVSRERLAVGSGIKFENVEWTVCGIFEAGGSLVESEVWARARDLMTALRRRTSTFAAIRFEDPAAAEAGLRRFQEAGALSRYFKAWRENDYYREFTGTLNWVYWLTLVMVIAVTIAGLLIGVNTMYTAIVGRIREIGTQRVLGYRRADIWASLVIESTCIALAGGMAGAGLARLVNAMPVGTSQGAFFLSVSMPVMAAGLLLAGVIGLLGASLPVWKALRVEIADALSHR